MNSAHSSRALYVIASALLFLAVWYFGVRPLVNSPSTNTYATLSNVNNYVNRGGFDVGRVFSSGDIACSLGQGDRAVEGVYRNFSFEISARFDERFDLNVIVEDSLRGQGVSIDNELSGGPGAVFEGVRGTKNGDSYSLSYTSNDKAVFVASTPCTDAAGDYIRYKAN